MSEKEKAVAIFDQFYLICTSLNNMASVGARTHHAKQCALLLAENHLAFLNKMEIIFSTNKHSIASHQEICMQASATKDLIKEIENL